MTRFSQNSKQGLKITNLCVYTEITANIGIKITQISYICIFIEQNTFLKNLYFLVKIYFKSLFLGLI